MKILLALLMLFSPAIPADPIARLVLVGQGEMNWMLWKIYDIRLYSADGGYAKNSVPVALSITYARDIKATRLLQSTVDEWQRLSIDYKPQWVQQLEQIWPSVKAGDTIDFVVNAEQANQFYWNKKLIGEITDASFAEAFLSIWLSPDSRQPGLRKLLTGDDNV